MKLMILDGNSILNRAFYGIRLLTTADGLYTNAVFGFITILRKLLAEDRPDALCVAFDLKAPTFRHKLYDGYKATRKGMPEELAVQLPWIRQVLDAMNIPRYELEGWEADDLLGAVSVKCAQAGWDCLVVTGDRDSLQLITDRTHVKLITTRTGRNDATEYDEAAFQAEYGFPPAGLVDLKALMGDSSDNIPGVKGVGSKTAMDLMHRFGSLDGVYAALADPSLKPSLRDKLAQGRDSAYLSYQLAAIRRDAPLDFAPAMALRQPPDNDALYALFSKLEFQKLRDDFGLTPPAATPPAALPSAAAAVSWREAAPEALLAACRASDTVYFVCDQALSALAVLTAGGGYTLRQPDASFLRAFFDTDIAKAGTDLKALMRVLLDQGLPFGGFVFDAALAAYVLDPGDGGASLARCAKKLLGLDLPEAVYDQEAALSPLGGSDEALAALQAHAEAVRALRDYAEPLLHAQEMWTLYQTVELPLCAVLAQMEHLGFPVEKAALARMGQTLGAGIEQLQQEIYALAGEEFNINSTKKLGEILFDRLGLPTFGKTKTGHSTNIEVLEKLRDKHPIVEKLIDYRKLTKLKSTYADGLLRFIGPDGRIHTSFNMTATATGRLSSTDPNLQNIPVRTELGGEVRKLFVAPAGMVFVDADYSQIELRVLSHLAGDKVMQQAFRDGEDIHRVTASQVFGVPPEEVSSLQRSRAKAVNFGIVYGISDYSLSQDIHVSRAEARDYIDNYLAHYSGVREFMRAAVEKARQDGYAVTLFGRRRYLPELQAANHNLRAFGERVAMNMPVQGTAADIIKLAMIRVANRLKQEAPQAKLLLQVHDELIAQCPEEMAEVVQRILTEEMAAAAALDVPLTAEAHAGKSWYDAK